MFKNKLARMMFDNRALKCDARGLSVVLNEASNEATIYLYDFIVSSKAEAEWYGGVAAETFAKEMASLKGKTIHLRINSPGGDVFGARAMELAVRNHDGKVVAHVDGYAASAATYVAMAAGEVEIHEGGFFMVHKAWTLDMGNADDFRKTAALLDQIDDTIVDTYMKRTGLTDSEVRDMMAEETWIGAEQAVEQGWATRVAEAVENKVNWNISALLQNSKSRKQEPVAAQPEQKDDGSRAHAERKLVHLNKVAS